MTVFFGGYKYDDAKGNPLPVDQPTGMNELREALKTLQAKTVAATPESWYLPMINEAEATVQQLVERCLPSSDIVSINAIRHNLQQAGLLRGDEG